MFSMSVNFVMFNVLKIEQSTGYNAPIQLKASITGADMQDFEVDVEYV